MDASFTPGEMSLADWDAQFARQARWTRATRGHLYRRAGLIRARRVLDVGCGTGVVTLEMARRTRGTVVGLDIDPAMLELARARGGRASYERGDALELHYPDEHFEIVSCHFVLMWVADPEQAVREMARVTTPGGSVLICAEPDYGGRLDWPILPIRRWQVEGLRRQGANPLIGRRLRQLLVTAGLHAEVGVIPSLWDANALRENFDAEWRWLHHDVGDAVPSAEFEQARLRAWAAIETGERLAYIPIFYAIGRKE